MPSVRISTDLALPLEIATESTAIVARKRMGKSWLARLMAEQLIRAGIQVVVVDPKGDWWGIRSSRDGKSPGIPIVILGGEHGDVPLEAASGEFVATFVVEKGVSVVLDLSLFRKHQLATFMAAFLETLYRLKARDEYRTAMTLVTDEADAIAPQQPKGNKTPGEFDNVPRMLGAMEDIVRRGGQRGIGIVMVTQRTAVLNKNVLTQTSVMMILCTTGKQDIDAIKDWIGLHGQPEEAKLVLDSIASLRRGQAWVWAPGWPAEDGTFRQVDVGEITTFDSGATPKIGQVRAKPKTVARVDLEVFRKSMAATIEKAKADDPKALRKRIAELEKKAANKAPETVRTVVDQAAIDQAVLDATAPLVKRLDAQEFIFSEFADISKILLELAGDRLGELSAAVKRMHNVCADHLAVEALVRKHEAAKPKPAPRKAPAVVAGPVYRVDLNNKPTAPAPVANGALTRPQAKIVNAVAWWNAIRVDKPDKRQVAFIAGYRPDTGSFKNTMGALRTAGFIDYPTPGLISLTAEGKALAVAPTIERGLAGFHQAVLAMLNGPQRKLLEVLIASYPEPMSTEALAEAAGYKPDTGSFKNTRGSLRTLGLIRYPSNATNVALDVLFPRGLR